MLWKFVGRKLAYTLILLLGLGVLLLNTNVGLKSLFWLGKTVLPYEISVTELQGTLLSTLECQNLEIKTPAFVFTAEKLTLDLRIHTLLYNTLRLAAFDLQTGKIVSTKPNANPLFITQATGALEWGMNGARAALRLDTLSGQWQDKLLTGQGSIQKLYDEIIVSTFSVTLGENHLKIIHSPHHPERLDFTFEINEQETVQAKVTGYLYTTQFKKAWVGDISQAEIFSHFGPAIKLKKPTKFLLSQNSASMETAEFILPPTTLRVPQVGNRFTSLPVLGGALKVALNEEGLAIQLNYLQSAKNEITGKIICPQFLKRAPLLEQPIEGTLRGKIHDPRFLYTLIPQIARIQATVEFVGEIKGSFKNPICHFFLKTFNSEFFIPKQNVKVTELNLELTGDIPGKLTLTGQGFLSKGPFQLKGYFAPFVPGAENTLTLHGTDMKIYNTSTMQILASPKLDITLSDHTLYVYGKVIIPKANIILQNELNRVAVSRDVVMTHPLPQDSSVKTFRVIPSLYLIIEKETFFKGYGLEGNIGGKLQIDEREDGILTGMGRLTIKEGTYRLQGAKRYIRRGRLLYPPGTLLNDPILDIRISQRRVDELQSVADLGIYVQGTLQKPRLQSYNLKGPEIISTLGFGQAEIGMIDEDQKQRAQKCQTALLVAGQANPIIESLQNNLGLEELNIEARETQNSNLMTEDPNDTVIVIGKSLSRRVYLQYLRSVLEPINKVRLKYLLNPYFTLSAETGTEGQGGDLIFSMETD